jgi:hypothetical protein
MVHVHADNFVAMVEMVMLAGASLSVVEIRVGLLVRVGGSR